MTNSKKFLDLFPNSPWMNFYDKALCGKPMCTQKKSIPCLYCFWWDEPYKKATSKWSKLNERS